MISGVYCIENIENGMRYIGKGKDIKRRIYASHKKSPYINNAINKYGKKNFIWYIVEYCEPEDMIYWEQYYIKEWNTKVPNGYNLTDGGQGVLNPSIETKIKMSVARLGITLPESTKKAMSLAHIGKEPWNKGIGFEFKNKKEKQKTGHKCKGENNLLFGRKIGKSSEYFCVTRFIRKNGKIGWAVSIRINGEIKRIGTYDSEISAAKAYDKYIVEYHINRPLNFPEDYE